MVSEAVRGVPRRSILEELSPTRAAILRLLKNEGFASIPRIAAALGVTHEAARKQISEMQRSGWLGADCPPAEADAAPVPGRPPVRYCLTRAGEHLFPKQYPELTLALLQSVPDDALVAALTSITDERVAGLAPRVDPLPLEQKVDELRAIYAEGDPYTTVEQRGDGPVLVERNCPYLDVALERPEICSTTVSALRRLTGREVVRERRFQDGDGRCEFHIRAAEAAPVDVRFEPEPPRVSR